MFIVIDGPDGAGKTTLCHNIVTHLESHQIKAVYTCEPTRTAVGRKLREIFKSNQKPDKLLEMIAIDRCEHISKEIVPYLKSNYMVVCDRYKYANLVYQTIQGFPTHDIVQYNATFLVPDLTLILYTQNVAVLIERIGTRKREQELLESQEILELVVRHYKTLPMHFPNEQLVYVDAEWSIEETTKSAINLITKELFE